MSQYVASNLRRGQSGLGQFAIAEYTDLKLSDTITVDLSGRDAIEAWRRTPFMSCYVISENKTYRLGSDITIAGQIWTEILYSDPDALVHDDVFDIDGFIKPGLIRNLFINDSFVVGSEAAMLATTSVTGNVFVRTDTGEVFLKLNNDDPSDISDFADITGNTGAVTSVNGMTGSVSITISNLLSVPANLTAFNTAVSSNSTVSGHTASIASLTTNKADLVSGTVPISQLPYLFDNGLSMVGNEVKFGGPLLYDTEIDLEDFNFKIKKTGTGKFGWDLGSDSTNDIFFRGSDGYLKRLPVGLSGQVLKVNGAVLQWSNDLGGTIGGSVAWGFISGLLSDQHDLQDALDAKQDIISLPANNFVFGTGTGVGTFGSNNFYANSNALVWMTQTPPTVHDTMNFVNNVWVFGENATIWGNPGAGTNGTVTDTFISGINQTVGDNTNFYSGSAGFVWGSDNYYYGYVGMVGGQYAELQHSGEVSGSLFSGGGIAIGLTIPTTDPTKHVIAYANAINFSANTSAQTSGHGALAPLSVIIGGQNHHIPATSPRSVIIAGNGITARASDPDQVYFPNINIVSTPGNDDALTQILARDPVTGKIKYRSASSMGSANALILGQANTRNPVADEATFVNMDYDFSFEQEFTIRTYVLGDNTSWSGLRVTSDFGNTYASLYSISAGIGEGYFRIGNPQLAEIFASNTTNSLSTIMQVGGGTGSYTITGTGTGNTFTTTGFNTGQFTYSGTSSSYNVTLNGAGGTVNGIKFQVQNTSTTGPLIMLLTPANSGIRLFGTSAAGQIIKATNTIGDSQWGSLDLSLAAAVGTSVLGISNGGTGLNTKNFVDLTTIQTVGGDKTFTGNTTLNQQGLTAIVPALQVNMGGHVGAASTTYRNVYFNMPSMQWATGSLSNQRFIDMGSPQMNFVGSSTASDATVLHVGVPSAGANATLTRPWSIWADGAIFSTGTASQFASSGLSAAFGANSTTTQVNSETVQIAVNQNANTYLLIQNSTSGASSSSGINIASTGTLVLRSTNGSFGASGIVQASKSLVYSISSLGLNVGTSDANPLQFWTNNTYRGGFLSGGALMVGSGAAAQLSTEQVLTRVDQNASTFIAVNNATNGTAASAGFVASAGAANFTTSFTLGIAASSNTTTNLGAGGNAYFSSSAPIQIGTTNANSVKFYTNNSYIGGWLSTGELMAGAGATALIGTEKALFRTDQNSSTDLFLLNATSGTAARASLRIRSGAANVNDSLLLMALSPAYTTSGILEQSKSVILGNGLSGFNIGTQINASIGLWTNNTLRVQLPGAGGLIIGTSAIASGALFDVQSTTLGSSAFPKMTTTQRDAIVSPSDGLYVHNITTHAPNFYNGTAWTSNIIGATGLTDNSILRADGTGGVTVQPSVTIMDDSGNTSQAAATHTQYYVKALEVNPSAVSAAAVDLLLATELSDGDAVTLIIDWVAKNSSGNTSAGGTIVATWSQDSGTLVKSGESATITNNNTGDTFGSNTTNSSSGKIQFTFQRTGSGTYYVACIARIIQTNH